MYIPGLYIVHIYTYTYMIFPSICFRFLFVWRVRRTLFPSGWCFFYLVTTGWIFYISLCENSINQSYIYITYNKCTVYNSLCFWPILWIWNYRGNPAYLVGTRWWVPAIIPRSQTCARLISLITQIFDNHHQNIGSSKLFYPYWNLAGLNGLLNSKNVQVTVPSP